MADSRTYFRIADDIDENPKMLELSNAAFRLDLHGISYCARRKTDGKVPKAMVPRLLGGPTSKALAELTTGERPRWIERKNHYEIRDYLEHQRSKASIESIANTRREAGKQGGRPKANGKQNVTQMTDDREQKDLKPSSPTDDARESFEKFWPRYPLQPNGKKPERHKALEQWKRLTPVERTRALSAVEHYRADCDRGTYAKHAFRWLRDGTYEDWTTPARADGQQVETCPHNTPLNSLHPCRSCIQEREEAEAS